MIGEKDRGGDNPVKAQLARKIASLMRERGLRQIDGLHVCKNQKHLQQAAICHIEAAGLFGVKQPDVSKLLRGDFRQFSLERLLRFLVALGQDVEISVRPHVGAAPSLRVD